MYMFIYVHVHIFIERKPSFNWSGWPGEPHSNELKACPRPGSRFEKTIQLSPRIVSIIPSDGWTAKEAGHQLWTVGRTRDWEERFTYFLPDPGGPGVWSWGLHVCIADMFISPQSERSELGAFYFCPGALSGYCCVWERVYFNWVWEWLLLCVKERLL